MKRQITIVVSCILIMLWLTFDATSAATLQETAEESPVAEKRPAVAPDPTTPELPKEVKVTDVVQDDDIGARLQEILKATEWFQNEKVDVSNGVVFLNGTTRDLKYNAWASSLASETEDVVAVVNRITVIYPPIMVFAPAWEEARQLGRTSLRSQISLRVAAC